VTHINPSMREIPFNSKFLNIDFMSLNINLQLFFNFYPVNAKKKISIHIIWGRHAFTIEIVYKGKQGKLASETAI